MVQAEQVMNDLNTKLRAKLDEVVQPLTDKVAEAQADFDAANEARSKTLQEKLTREKVFVKAEQDLAAKPDDEELKAAVEVAKADSEAAAAADFAEEQRVTQMEAGVEAAKQAVVDARVAFDLSAEFAALTEGKTGFVVKETDGLLDAEQLATWEEGVNADIAKAEQQLKIPGLGARAKKIWEQSLSSKQGELASKDARVKSTEVTVDREIDAEVRAEALNHYGEVIDAAAAELGFELRSLGPLPQKLSSRPRFDDSYDKTTRYVYRMHNEMEAGDAVGPIYQDRSVHVIVCTDVAPLEASDVTRREFEMLRKNFAARQMASILGASFTQEELALRYGLEKPVGEQFDPQ